MDAPKDVGQRNIAAEEGGQQQMHDDKPHKPMLKKVRDKMKKIRNTITGHGVEHEDEHDTGGSSSIDIDEDDAALREDEVQEDVEDKRVMDTGPELHGAPIYDSETIPSAAKDVERNEATGMRLGDLGGQAAAKGVDQRNDATGTGMRLGDLGGQAERNDDRAVRYDDLGGQAATKGVERNDSTGMRLGDLGGQAAEKGVERNDDPAVRLGDLGGQAATKGVERNDSTGMRLGDLGGQAAEKGGERNDDLAVRLGDLGGQAAAKGVERNDDPAVRLSDLGGQAAGKGVEHNDDPGVRYDDLGGQAATKGVERNDSTGMRLGDLGGQAAEKGVERNDDLAVRLGDLGGQAAAKDDDPAVRLSDLGGQAAGKGVEHNDDPGVRLGDLGSPVVEDLAAPHSKTPTPRGGEDIGTTWRNFQAMTVSDDPKQAGAEKMDLDQVKETTEAMPVSDGTGEEWTDAPTDAAYTGSYTDGLKNTAAGTTEYGKNLASTVDEKVADVGTVVASKAQQVTPGFGAGGNAQDDSGTTEPMDVDAGKTDLDLPKEGTPASYPGTEELKNAATDATTEGAPAATYTDMIKSAAAGTTEYGMQLASSVYGKVAGVGTAMANRVMPSSGTASPGVGAQDGSAAATVTPGAAEPGNGQDKGVSGMTAYIAEKLSPGDDERSLSEGITGTVQQYKEGVGSTVAKARDAVTSLTGGNRVSETVQPTTEGNIGGGVAAVGPTLRGEEIEAPRTDTNVM